MRASVILRLFLICLFGLTACQNFKTRSEIEKDKTAVGNSTGIGSSSGAKSTSTGPNIIQENPETTGPSGPAVVGSSAKIGLILGPGALRAYAHVGFVQELAKQKVPIFAVTGFEMGALVAAIYANKALPFDVEWQMMKLKENELLDKSFMSGDLRPGDVKQLQNFFNETFQGAKVENAKLPFACAALNTEKNQTYMMNRGNFSQVLPYCLAFPPLYSSYQKNVSSVFDVKAAADFLRAKGVNYVIYVSVLNGGIHSGRLPPETQTLWSLMSYHLQKNLPGVDYTVSIPMTDYDIIDFSKRREMIQRGQKAGAQAAEQIMRKLGL